MLGTLSKTLKSLVLTWALFHTIGNLAAAQTYPEIPNQLTFGGITVNFDRSAQSLIEEDVRSLMANKKFWEEKMDRAMLYFPIVESILMDEEVPIDFKYLAVQESSFKPDVISTSNAVGYWQFKPETAIGLNLRVDSEIDERKNISSSTHAAAWYLKKNNQQFNNWVSTLYSYYLGASGVKKNLPPNWVYAREISLNGKTDRYMLRFFAHKIALEAGIEKYRSNNKIMLMESDYGKGHSFDQIALALDVDAQDLRSYNRWLNEDKIPTDGEYLVLLPIPLDKVESVRQKLSVQVSSIINRNIMSESGYPILKKSDVQSSDKNAPTFYEINGLPGIEARPGDRPKTLAKAGKIRTPVFLKYNDMIRDMPLIPGKVYYLARKNKKAATPFHTAEPGDTWQSVSQQYAVKLVNLLKYNRTISRNYPIQTGQVLWLTEKRPRKTPVEIKTPTSPGGKPANTEAPIAAAETEKTVPATTSAASEVPTKPSGRKKYTPVLVDKTDTAAPAETKAAEPAVATATDTKAPEKENLYKNSKDRVVVISSPDETNRPASATKTAEKKTETVTPPKQTPVKTPVTTAPAPQPRETTEVASSGTGPEFHTVEKGQTYFSISKMNGLSIKQLLELNGLSENDKLSVGQKLRVQKQAVVVSTAEKSVPAPSGSSKNAEGTVVHTVATGETLYRISKNYDVNIEDIKTLNNLASYSVQLGQKLKIPQKK
jgi:membrane-bound lytic murein transglycosylase D